MSFNLLPRQLDKQVAIIISVIVFVSISIFSGLTFRHMTADLSYALRAQGEVLSSNIAYLITQQESFSREQLQAVFDVNVQLDDINEISLLSTKGLIISSVTQLSYGAHHHNNPDIEAKEIKLPETDFYDEKNAVVWHSFNSNGEKLWIKVELNNHSIEHHLVEHLTNTTIFAFSTIIIISLITIRFFRRPVNYIKKAAAFAELIDNSNKNNFEIYQGIDELEALGKSLNLASQRLLITESETKEAISILETQKFALDQHAIVTITDTKGNIIYANKKFCEISGYSRKELIGANHRILRSNFHTPQFFKNLWNTIASGNVWKGSIQNLSKSGKPFWSDTTIVPFLDLNNKPYQYVAIRNDITALKKATQDLFENEQRLQLSQDFAQIGSWELLLENNRFFISKMVKKLLGNPRLPSTIKKERFIEHIYYEDRELVASALESCIQTGRRYQVEYRIVMPDHSIRWLQDSGNVLHDNSGTALKVLGISQDVTDFHLALQKIKELARFPNENPNPVLRITHNMEILYANPASEILLKHWHLKTNDKAPAEIQEHAKEVISEKSTVTFDLDIKDRSYSTTVSFVPEAGYLNIYMKEITERKRAEKQLQNYQRHLEYLVDERTADLIKARDDALVAERSMSTFLTNMSHELRTPLHAILSFADFGIKKSDKSNPEKLKEYFNKIHISGANLLELVNNLLDLSKLRAGKMSYRFEELNLTNLIEQVKNEVNVLAEKKHISIINYNKDNTISANFDRMRISQVIRNLLSNAIKFSPKNSQIMIYTRTEENGAIVEIQDEGVGIPQDELELVFESFSQSSLTQTNAGGTGLGLPICKEIIEAGHEGWIKAENAENAENGGAIFSFYIPFINKRKTPETIDTASGQN